MIAKEEGYEMTFDSRYEGGRRRGCKTMVERGMQIGYQISGIRHSYFTWETVS